MTQAPMVAGPIHMTKTSMLQLTIRCFWTQVMRAMCLITMAVLRRRSSIRSPPPVVQLTTKAASCLLLSNFNRPHDQLQGQLGKSSGQRHHHPPRLNSLPCQHSLPRHRRPSLVTTEDNFHPPSTTFKKLPDQSQGQRKHHLPPVTIVGSHLAEVGSEL